MQFAELEIGDTFRVKSGDFVKIDDTDGMVIYSSVHELGSVFNFSLQDEIIVLYSRKISQQHSKLLEYCEYLRQCIRWENNYPKTLEEFYYGRNG